MLTPGSIGRELGATGFVKGTCLRQVETILHKIVTGKLRGDLRSPSYQAETIAQDTEF